MSQEQYIYGRQYYIDPTNFGGRSLSWYFIGTLKYRTDTYWVFDEVDMIVYQNREEIITTLGDNKKFECDKFKVTF